MIILMALVLVWIWAEVIMWIYAIINPFMDDLKNVQNYNTAYYGAIAWIERAELVLRWHTAGFEWSWWWLGTNVYWNESDYKNDIVKKRYFGKLIYKSQWNGFFWSIKNLTNSIPWTGKWDLDPDFSSWNDYLKLTFDKSLQMALYKDNTWKDNYYTWYSSLDNIVINWGLNVSIRVPQKLYNKYTNWVWWNDALDINSDLDGDEVNNDIIVNRTLFGLTWDTEFTIFPSINIDDNAQVKANDTAIRESVINSYTNDEPYNIVFDASTNSTNPVNSNWWAGNDPTNFNQSPEDAVSTWFDNVFSNDNISQLHAKFSLINLLKYNENSIYPYLEIKLEVNNDSVINIPDSNFHILWEWKVGEYDVKIKMEKSVFETSAASDFTVLF